MPTVKLNISLDAEVAQTLRRRAEELRKPASHYLADLIREDARRQQDELAAEGYRLLSDDTASFAAAAWPLAVEVWSEWEGKGPDRSGPAGRTDRVTDSGEHAPGGGGAALRAGFVMARW